MARREPVSKSPRIGRARPLRLHSGVFLGMGRAVQRISWAYLGVVLALWIFLRFAGDRWWLATLMLFGPIWVTLLPAGVLVPAAVVFRRRSLWVLLGAIGVCLFPIMGLCVPWRTLFQSHPGIQHIRVLTCNIHRSRNDGALADLISQSNPDVIVFQEFPDRHTHAFLVDPGWHTQTRGELFLASRYPIVGAEDFGEDRWFEWGGVVVRYDLGAPEGTIHLFCVHLASPHNPFQDVIDAKPSGTTHLKNHIAVRTEQSEKVSRIVAELNGAGIIAGDLNTIGQGSVYHQYWSQFSDAYSTAGWGLGHTYQDGGASVRIDHILSGSDWQCRRCWIGPPVGSPHLPVIADLERVIK